MKIIIKSLLIFSLTAIGFSCADPDLDPLQQERVLKGTILALRGAQLDAVYWEGLDYGASFFYDKVTGTETFEYDAELLAEDPNSLESVDIFVIKEGSPAQRLLLTNVPGSSFAVGDYRGPSTSVSLTLASILTKIGADLSTPAGQAAFIALYEGGIRMESDLNLKNGTKVLASQLVAAGLYESDQFYPAQFMTYGVESIQDVRPVATTSLRGQVSIVSGKVVRTVLPLKSGAKDTLNIAFDQKIATPPTVIFSPAGAGTGTAGAVTAYGTSGKTFYVAFTAGATFTGDATFTISGATSAEAAPLTGLVSVTKTATIAVDNLAPQNTSFTTGGPIGKGQAATITLKYNEPLGTAPTITITAGTTGIEGLPTAAKATLSSDGLTATLVYEYKDTDNNATHGDATVTIVSSGLDRAGNAAPAIASKPLTIDLGPATAPTVTLDPTQYNWGTQIRWTLSSAATPAAGGAKSGSIYYLALADGATPPVEILGGDVPLFRFADNSTKAPTGVVAVGSTGDSGSVFSPLTAKGDLDVYVAHISTTGVRSAVSAPTNVVMN